jgi:hypothetical protein
LKCRVFAGNPLQRSGSGLELDPEPNPEFGPVAHTKQGTPKPDPPSTPKSDSGSSDDHDSQADEYVSLFQGCLGLDPDCKRMFDNETKMLVHHVCKMWNKAKPIFQQVVNQDHVLFKEA